VREICATNLPCGMEPDKRFLRAGAPAVSNLSAKWMKTQFKLPRNGSAQGRPQLDASAGSWTATARRPLTRIASTFQLQIPFGQGPRKESGTGCHAAQTTQGLRSATQPHELDRFQPSMLCNRSLPIYLSNDRAVPPNSYEQMRGLTPCP
jgi:hypothetical protein